MIGKDKINEIIQKITNNYSPEKIILFGSYANGKPDKDSDLDILVVKDTDLPRHQRSHEVRKLLFHSMIPMDILVYTKKEFEEEQKNKYSFIYSVIKNGIVLYKRKD